MKKQVVVALFAAVFLFSLGLVSAAFWDEASNVGQFVKNLADGTPDLVYAKWLVFLLVLIILFSVTELLPFFEERTVMSSIFSLVVAILAVFFLTPNQLLAALMSFKALSITLTAIIPFCFILFISYMTYKKNQPFIATFFWILFIATLVWLIFEAYAGAEAASYLYTYVGVLLLSIIMLFWGHNVFSAFYKQETKAIVAGAEARVQREIVLNIVRLEEELGNTKDPAAAKLINDKIKELKKRIK